MVILSGNIICSLPTGVVIGADCPNHMGSGAQLQYCNLTNANLVFAYLTGANLTGANLTGALMSSAILTGAKGCCFFKESKK